jgi:hypothetical protein
MANKYGEHWYDVPLLTFVTIVLGGTAIIGAVGLWEAVKAVWGAF